MRPSLRILLFAAGALFASGCKLPNDGTVDTFGPPFVRSISLDSTFSHVPPRGGSDTSMTIERTVTVFASVRKDSLGLPIANVTCTVTAPDGTVLLNDAALRDDGAAPDSIANDGRYALRSTLRIQRNVIGGYIFQVTAHDNAGTRSNVLAAAYVLKISNYPPTLAAPVVPDTVIVPQAPQINSLLLTIAASDTNGLDDIAAVKVKIYRVPEGTPVGTYYDLYDDGGKVIVQPFGAVSGDVTAGDGVYSLVFPVTSSTFHDIMRDFVFVAIDRSGAESVTKTKRVYFK